MARKVLPEEKDSAIQLMFQEVPQREIEKITGLSRPYIRKLALEVGFSFPQNGIDVLSPVAVCCGCGAFFRRPQSKLDRSKRQFCDSICKSNYMKGQIAAGWIDGRSVKSFSSFITSQSGYKEWKQAALDKSGYRCEISGLENDLEVHHIYPKAEKNSPEMALDPKNAIVLNTKVHDEIHSLISQGKGYEESVEILKEKYKDVKIHNNN